MNFVNFKYLVSDNIEKIIIVVCLVSLAGLGISYYDYSQLKKFTKQTSSILDSADFIQSGILTDYKKYQTTALEPSMENSIELVTKHQTDPMAYMFFTSRIISFLHRDNISYGNKKTFKVTSTMKLDAQKKAQEVLALYRKNEANFYPVTKKIEDNSKQYFIILNQSSYDEIIKSSKDGDKEVDIKIKRKLSQLEPENRLVWQDYYQKLDKTKADPENNQLPKYPDTILK